jgi:hypothetical protein
MQFYLCFFLIWDVDLKSSLKWLRVRTPPFPFTFLHSRVLLSVLRSFSLSSSFFYVIRKYGAVVTVCVRWRRKKEKRTEKVGKKREKKERKKKICWPHFLLQYSYCTTNKLDGLIFDSSLVLLNKNTCIKQTECRIRNNINRP